MSHVALETIQRYLRNELRPAEQAACDGHFAECAACRTALQAERALMGLIRLDAAVAPAPSPAGVERAIDRVRRAAKLPPPPRRVFWITATASLMMIALVAIFVPAPEPDRTVVLAPSGIDVDTERDLASVMDGLIALDEHRWLATSGYESVLAADAELREAPK